MLILRAFRCEKCDYVFEDLVDSKEYNHTCPECSAPANITITRVNIKSTGKQFHPHYDHQLGAYFGSADEKKTHLKSVGKEHNSGAFSPTQNTPTRTICTKEQAKKLDPRVR